MNPKTCRVCPTITLFAIGVLCFSHPLPLSHGDELQQLTGPRLNGLQAQPVAYPPLADTVLVPFVDFLSYVDHLGDKGSLYLLVWLCVAYLIWAGFRCRGTCRSAFIARALLFLLFTLQVLFLSLHLSSFFGRAHRLVVTSTPPRPVGMIRKPKGKASFAIGDFHCHSNHSTGFLSPAQLVEWHRRRGYNVMAVTDNNKITGALEARAYARKRYPNFRVIIGQEYKTSKSAPHLVLLGIEQPVPPKQFRSLESAIHETHRQGGLAIVAHPWSSKKRTIEELAALGVDGFEMVNGVMSGNEALSSLCISRNLVMLAATDLKKGARAYAWNVYPVYTQTSFRDAPRDSDFLQTFQNRRNSIVTLMQTPPVDGFAHPDWRPPASLLSPVTGLKWVFTDMTVPRAVAWACWFVVAALLFKGYRRYARPALAQRTPAKPSARKRRVVLGYSLLLLAAFGILLGGAFTAAYDLKDLLSLTWGQCVLWWIIMDGLAILGYRQIAA